MTSIWTHAATANLAFKAQYKRRLEMALAFGLLLHLAVIFAMPPLEIAPYQLAEESIFRAIDLPPEIEVLPPPPEVKRPPLPAEIDIDDFAPMDNTIAPTVDNPFVHPGGDLQETRGRDFYARTTDAVLLKAVEPAYPPLARQAGAEGMVWVEVFIDETGRVADARVFRAEAVASLQRAALTAARRYLFSPARQRDRAVPVRMIIPFSFRLR